jgi:site-specific DNA-methyltransferase (adenine-specific)
LSDNFRNEIVWCYETAGKAKRNFSKKHDVILFYTKSEEWTFNADAVAIPRKPGKHMRVGIDEDGREYEEKTDKKSGKVYRWYFDKGRLPFDYWTDIQFINREEAQRLGYPTQKPEALLERIIKASSNEGDWVLDPFGGCGTTVAAAEILKRNWAMIDVTTLAINLVKRRLEDMYPEQAPSVNIEGLPEDLSGAKTLFETDPFEFEYWCCDFIQARPAKGKSRGKMKGPDTGVDGTATFKDVVPGTSQIEYRKIIVQVKGGHVTSPQVRDFRGTIDREKAAGGVFITLQKPTGPMKKEAVEAGEYEYHLTGQKFPRIQITTVEDLLKGKRPHSPSIVPYSKRAEKAERDLQPKLFG